MNLKEILNHPFISVGKYEFDLTNVLVVIVLYLATRLFLFLLKKAFKRGTIENQSRRLSIFQLVKYLIWVLAITTMLESIGIKVSFLLAGSAALLVGIGLGLQQIFNDLMSGIIILYEGTIKKGDTMEVDGIVGRVEHIYLRTSVLISRDGVNVIIPNHKFITENVINWSHNNSFKRFDVKVGVAYNSNLDLVKKLLMECAMKHPDVITTDETMKPFVRLEDFGNSSIDLSLLFWSSNIFKIESTKSDIRFSIAKIFEQQKVVIPFPQRDLHVFLPPANEASEKIK